MFQNNPDQDVIDPNKDYLEDLVGEGKKYADVAALTRAVLHKDQHIKRLESENNGMRKDFSDWREQQNTVLSLKEVLDQLKEQNASGDKTPEGTGEEQTQRVDMKEIETLFSNKYQEFKSMERRQQNEQSVLSKLKERYGESYEQHLKTQMDEIGMSQDEALELAREKPQAFTKLFMEERKTETFQAPPNNARRSDSFAPSGAQKRDMAYYEKIRAEKPDVYWSPKIQGQMHEDAERLGESFFV